MSYGARERLPCRRGVRAAGSHRSRQIAKFHHPFVIRDFSGENQPQREERQVRGARPQDVHALVKRRRASASGPLAQQDLHHLRLRRPAVEKVAVQVLEVHAMRFAAVIAVLCALGAVPARTGFVPFDQVLARMRAAAGDVFAAHVVSEFTRTIDGAPVEFQTDAQGSEFWLRQCTGTVCFGTYSDGLTLYEVNINGTALPRAGGGNDELGILRTAATLEFLEPQFAKGGGTIADGGTVQFGTCRCRRIVLRAPDGAPAEAFVDPSTWLLAGVRDPEKTTYVMRDYRRVGGLELPFEIDRNGRIEQQYDTRTVVTTPFARPAGLLGTFAGFPAMASIESGSSTPVTKCTLGGVAVRCLFDTGNSGLSMSLELAERLNLSPVGAFRVRGLGDYATEVVRAGPLSFGNITFGDADYIVLSDIHRYGYDLILGADVLASAPVTIDYGRHAIFFGPDPYLRGSGQPIALQFENFVPVVGAVLGSTAAQLAVDTGDQSTINLSHDFYLTHPAIFTPTSTRRVSGVGGDSQELIGIAPTVSVGNQVLHNEAIGTTQMLKGTADGHLGAGFLSAYDVVLDYGRRSLVLLPR